MKNFWLLSMRKFTLLLKRIPGTVLALDRIRRFFTKSGNCIWVDDFDGGTKAKLCLNEHMQSHIFWYGYYSRDVVYVLDRLVRPGMVVMDIGANIGEISMALAKRVGANGRVFSFEPMDKLYARLSEHIAVNSFYQVKALNIGLSDKAGSAKIYSANEVFKDGAEHQGLGTIYASKTRSVLDQVITLSTLDQVVAENGLQRLDLMKIDVEGAELSVLKGGLATLERFRPMIVIEIQSETSHDAGYEPADILGLLSRFGYTFQIIGRKGSLKSVTAEGLTKFQNVLCVAPNYKA